jgi:8-oxo-dGTP pyrophosphatase MutT (NUDIX family)
MTHHIKVVRCFVIKDERVLLVDSGGAYPFLLPPNGIYELPGGKIEAGETPEQAGIRELREETGLNAKELIFLDMSRYTAFFLAKEISNLDEEKADLEADEILDVRWFPLNEVLKGNLSRDTRAAFAITGVMSRLKSSN